MGQQKKLPVSQESPLKGSHGLRMYTNALTLAITSRTTARRLPVAYMKCVE